VLHCAGIELNVVVSGLEQARRKLISPGASPVRTSSAKSKKISGRYQTE